MSHRSYGRTQPSTAPAHINKDLGGLLKRFTSTASITQAVKVTDVQTVASYSWIEAPTPTIAVPGMPTV